MSSSSDSEESSSSDSEESSTEPVSLAAVVEEMTEVMATLKNTTGDVSAATDNKELLETKVCYPYHTYETKSQRLYLGDHLASIGASEVFTSNIAWLRGLDHGGFSDDVWPYLDCLYDCCQYYADCSEKFAEELGEAGIIPVLVQDLQKFKDTYTTNENQQDVVGSSLAIMCNMSKLSSIRPLFSESNAIESLIPYLEADRGKKTMATLTLAYTVDEENLGIMADSSVISFIIEIFKEAVDNDAKRHLGFSASELAMGIEALSVNDTPDDNNKLTLVAEGVLPPLIKLMTEGDEEEQLHAIRAISQLAFRQDNKEKIQPVVPQLQEFKSSENIDIALAASGALWQLQDAESRQQNVFVVDVASDDGDTADRRDGSNVRHVMLSYQWDNQKTVKKIKTSLEAKGYKVWMDIDRMGGSTLEAMAKAVEGAAVVLVCMSRKYKESANCRRECVYATTREVAIIPLKMEDSYKPDGWLGITVGADLFFNFDDKESFEHVMMRLVKEIGDRGKDGATDVAEKRSLHEWTQEDIRIWAEENQLEGDLEKLESEDLHFLRKMKKEAPAEFYKSIEEDLGLKSISSKRKFCNALKKTQKSGTFKQDTSVVKGSTTCQII